MNLLIFIICGLFIFVILVVLFIFLNYSLNVYFLNKRNKSLYKTLSSLNCDVYTDYGLKIFKNGKVVEEKRPIKA